MIRCAPGAPTSAVSADVSLNRSSKMRGRSPRFTVALCLTAIGLAGGFLGLQSDAYQNWRLARLSLPALRQELAARGENARLLYHIGLRLNQARRFAEADGFLRQCVGLVPDNPRYRDEWAQALLGSGLTTAAFGELREFAGTNPNAPAAHFILGKFYYTQNSMLRASEEFERAVALDANLADAWMYLAGARNSLGDATKGQAAAKQAVRLRPHSAEAHLLLASFYARNHQQEAGAEFAQAVALAPAKAVMHQEYARWLLDSAQSPADRGRAAEQARQAVALGEIDPASFLTLGRALLYNGDRAGAVAPFLRAAELAPDDPAPALALSQTYHALNRAGESQTWQRDYLVRQRYQQQRNNLLMAVVNAPHADAPKARLARLLGRHGDADECARNYAMAMRKPLDSPAVMTAAANDLTQGGHADRALPLARRATGFGPHSPSAHEALGDALLQVGQREAARAEYEQTARLAPDRLSGLQARLQRCAAPAP